MSEKAKHKTSIYDKAMRKTSIQIDEDSYQGILKVIEKRPGRPSVSSIIQEAINDYLGKQEGMDKEIQDIKKRLDVLEEKVL